jgi:condensin complex subunit 1
MVDFDLELEVGSFSKDSHPTDDFHYSTCHNKVTDRLAQSPMNVMDEDVFEDFKQLIYAVPLYKDPREMKKVLSIYLTLSSSLQSETDVINQLGFDIDASEHKNVLHRYIYLVYTASEHLVPMFSQEEKSKKKGLDGDAERKKQESLNRIVCSLLNTLTDLMQLQLSTILQSEQEVTDFCGVMLKAIYLILMSREAIKEKTNRGLLIKLFCIVAKNHHQNNQVSSRLMMALPFQEHVAEPIAEVISLSVTNYDNRNLLQDILSSLSSVNSMSNNLAKNISIMLIKLSEYLGQDTIKFISQLSEFERTSPTVRASLMICYGNCINSLAISKELLSQYDETVQELFTKLEQELLDSYQVVRQRSIQAIELICSNEGSKLDIKDRRLIWSLCAIRHLDDKSSFVRKAAINLLKCLIRTHPFEMNDGKLSWSFYWNKYVESTQKIKNYSPVVYNEIRRKEIQDDEYSKVIEEEEDDLQNVFGMVLGAIAPANTDPMINLPEEIVQTYLTRSYCRDACIFIKVLDKSFEITGMLLNSKHKTDSISAIEYFTIGDVFDIASSKPGVKQMLHLIWKGGSNEDGNRVVEKLLDSYISMFLTPYQHDTAVNKNIYVATSLIKLTYNCSMGDLISLEKMIVELYKGREIDVPKKVREEKNYRPQYEYYIGPQVIETLWHSFVHPKHEREKRGAIIILSMIASYDYKVVYDKLPLLVQYGMNLDELNYQITTFACIALRRVLPKKAPEDFVYPNFSKAIETLKKLLLVNTNNGEWYNLAEEALSTLYEISLESDDCATDVLRQKALVTFSDNADISVDKTSCLSQFLFLLGHTGLKTIIYLEKCEAEFKRKKQDHENKKDEHEMELDMIGGTNEDEFTDAVQNIKERELLYGPNSILAKFIPIVIEIITKPKKYNDKILQRQATLCFAKFMCISSRFCETHLPLYLSLTEKSSDPIVRSNLVLGLGDIAVCFTNIIDENKSALYSQLQDRDLTVQRTCLMTVTFLILAGQIKVKGQLSQLAKLVVHQDKGLKEMSRLFFQELATKDNAIYNGFIELLSGLNQHIDDDDATSAAASRRAAHTFNENEKVFPLDKFKEVMKFVLPFVRKDSQRYSLVKKLDSRLKACTENEFTRYAICIKELIKRDDSSTKKDADSEKARYYREIMEKIRKREEGESEPSANNGPVVL